MKGMIPQQYPGYPGVRPPKGWVPPLGQLLELLGVYNNETGYWEGLPLQALTEGLLNAEALHTEDRIDGGTVIECDAPSGAEADTIKTKEYEVPADEVWWIERFRLVTESEVLGNIRISTFPRTNDTDKALLAVNQAEPSGGHATYQVDYDLADPSVLGAPLRLLGGDKITVVTKVHAVGATTADRTVGLTIYGRKARRLV